MQLYVSILFKTLCLQIIQTNMAHRIALKLYYTEKTAKSYKIIVKSTSKKTELHFAIYDILQYCIS